MQRRYNLADFILASVIVFGLTLLMVCVDAHAQIAFTSEKDGNREIYVMNTEGGQQRNCTKDMHGDAPSWSPDGKRIVFVSERDGNKEIYTINADGRRDLQRLTDNPQADTDPAWFDPAFAFAVALAGKKITIWGWLKQID